jgi:hypothetical protein
MVRLERQWAGAVMVYGNTRIATGAGSGKGGESDGSKVDSHERSTDGTGEDAGW